MSVVIGAVGRDEWVQELGEGNWGSPRITVSDKNLALVFSDYEEAAEIAFESGILDETKWGIEDN